MQKYTITTEDILDANRGLQLLTGRDIPLILSVRVGQALRRLKPYVKKYNEDRDDIIMKYGKPNDEGGYNLVPPKKGGSQDKLDEANNLLDELLAEEHTIRLREIPLSLFKKKDAEKKADEKDKYMDVDPAVFYYAAFLIRNDIDGEDEEAIDPPEKPQKTKGNHKPPKPQDEAVEA